MTEPSENKNGEFPEQAVNDDDNLDKKSSSMELAAPFKSLAAPFQVRNDYEHDIIDFN